MAYKIPIQGLGEGIYTYEFNIGQHFFRCFEYAPVQDGSIALTFTLDKRPNFMQADIALQGTVKSDCDRCLAPIDLPIQGEYQLIFKIQNEEAVRDDDADIIYLPDMKSALDIAPIVYEFVCLSIPITKVFDCEEEKIPPCDKEMLQKLNKQEQNTEKEDTASVWDVLKNIK